MSGGFHNWADGTMATVGGGNYNAASNGYATVSGGSRNQAGGDYSFVGGGQDNVADGDSSCIGGGSRNTASGNGSTVAGGASNTTIFGFSTVGGGYHNEASGSYAIVAGGTDNTAGGDNSAVGGGYHNTTSGYVATVGGGGYNNAISGSSTVGGGEHNTASGRYTTVAGGNDNEANGIWATVPGGYDNTADGAVSFAAGRQAKALHHGTFVWADNTLADFQSTAENQFLIRASGGVGIGTITPGAMLDVSGPLNALRLRSGNGQLEFGKSQVVMSYNQSTTYSHAIKTRHSNGNASMNAIEFYVWDPATDASIEIGTKHVMTIDGEGNGEVGIGTTDPNCMLDVRGTICNNTAIHHSDERWKMDIRTIPDALDKITALRGVDFKWRQEEYAEMNFPAGNHLGVIAQEVEDVIPELVHTADNGYKSVEYANLTALLIEAVKEQQVTIETLQARLEKIEQRLK